MTKVGSKTELQKALQVEHPNKAKPAQKNGKSAEFSNILEKTSSKALQSQKTGGLDDGLRFSKHAMERLKERKIELGGDEFMKIKSAIEKIRGKGGRDSLIVAKDSAYIVDVEKNTVVTAMDLKGMKDNVFTKIDSTFFINE